MDNLTNVVEHIKKTIYQVAIYIRLSKEDEKIGESESVISQKSLLLKYVKDNKYNLFDIYIDDGFTGTNFNRPGFKRMIKDIEQNKVNMVVTKDLSRLGRDYIETGKYIEKWFPKHNIRYISVLDGIDTFLNNANNEIAPFKQIINDMYSRDNSKKIRSALRTRQEQGLWVGGCPPFGYKVSASNKNQLVINDDEAPIVRKIFNLALKGNSKSKIIQILFDEKIPTPSMIRKVKRDRKYADIGYWNTTTIKAMLTNDLYTGDLVQNRRSRISYKVRNVVPNDKSQWIIVKNTHEAIIDKETFNEVQRITKNSKGFQSKKKLRGVLDGLIYCGECKKKLGVCGGNSGNNHGHYYTYCYTYRKYSKLKLCSSHSTNYGKLEKAVLNQIKIIFDNFIDRNKTNSNLIKNKEILKNTNDSTLTLKKVEQDLVTKKQLLDKMYLEKLEGKVSEEMYTRLYQKIIEELKNLEDKKNTLINNISNDEFSNNETNYLKLIKEFLSLEEPSRDLALRLIKKIEYHQDKTVDLYFNFKKLNIIIHN